MRNFKIGLCAATALVVSLSAAPVLAQTAADDQDQIVVTGHPEIGDFGLNMTYIDTGVKPGDDFEKYASGNWLKTAEIPADRPLTGAVLDIVDRVQDDLKELITNAPAGTRYGTMYASYMDEKAIEKKGIAPLLADLKGLRAVSDKSEFARYLGATYDRLGSSLIGMGVEADTANPEMNVLWLGQGGLGLPEKSYYLEPGFAKQRQAYYSYIQRTLKAIGTPDPAAAAARVMAFETEIAQLSWDAADRRQIEKINNPYSTAELKAYAPGIDWDAWFAGANIPPQSRMIVGENTAVKQIAALFDATPLETLKLWEEFHMADQASPYLNKAMVDSRFEYTSALSGTTQLLPRWKRALGVIDGTLGEDVGHAYVDKHFPPSAKAKMQAMVANLKQAMANRIEQNSWMSGPTKQAALEKLSKMQVMVGYPDKWRDYSSLDLSADDLYGNLAQARKLNADYAMSFLGKPVDRKLWAMNPQTVNAYNGGLENKIVFPAAYLQPPYFDPQADAAVNYGAVGATIGHEISHGFDDQGRKIDADGKVRDWWTPEDAARFNAQAEEFGKQYAKLEIVPGAKINPALTMGENIADLAGLTEAYDAYHLSLDGKEAPVLDGLTGDQRFFLAYAQSWRSKWREDLLKQIMSSDPHSPDRARILVPVSNLDAWYDAFGIGPDNAMYIPPEKRARIW